MFYYRAKYGSAKIMRALLGEEGYAKWFYHLYTGKRLNLEKPQTFNEKGWWLKLHNHNPLMTKCSDKFLAREYVKECGYEDILIPQYGCYTSVDELDFSKYQEPVVVKCTHNSGGHVFYDPSRGMSEKEIREAKKRLRFILKQNASVLSLEWNYKNIQPRIIVEKMILEKDGEIPTDYDFFCFDGEPKIVSVDYGVVNLSNDSVKHTRNIYDTDFKLLPVKWYRENNPDADGKPENFERMVEIARKLSRPFPMVRVDLYNVSGQIFFGEMTFYHGGCCQNIEPEEWEKKLGSWIDLNSPKIVRRK